MNCPYDATNHEFMTGGTRMNRRHWMIGCALATAAPSALAVDFADVVVENGMMSSVSVESVRPFPSRGAGMVIFQTWSSWYKTTNPVRVEEYVASCKGPRLFMVDRVTITGDKGVISDEAQKNARLAPLPATGAVRRHVDFACRLAGEML